MVNVLFRCENCGVFHILKSSALKCHNGDIGKYEGRLVFWKKYRNTKRENRE